MRLDGSRGLYRIGISVVSRNSTIEWLPGMALERCSVEPRAG
jgi:hypothetical protein